MSVSKEEPQGAAQKTAQEAAWVFVIDDDASLRESLADLFQSVGLQAKGFASVAEYLQFKGVDGPSCLVLDVRLPGLSGLDFQSELARSNTLAQIIFMTGHGDIPMSVRAMKGGAVDFLTKPFRDQDMLDAVALALDRDRKRRQSDKALSKLESTFASLSQREQQIMTLVTSGLMNKQIAAEVGLSEATVKFHRSNIMRKMDAKSLAELIGMADTLGVRRPAGSQT
jgi:FixJ family two-component response regulator